MIDNSGYDRGKCKLGRETLGDWYYCNGNSCEKKVRADERAKTIDEVVSWILSRFTYTDELIIERVHCNADTLQINLKMQLKGEAE